MRYSFAVLNTVPALNQKTLLKDLQREKRESTWVEAKVKIHTGYLDTQHGATGSPRKFFPPLSEMSTVRNGHEEGKHSC